MAKYTIELRHVLGFYNKYKEDKSTFSVDETIENSVNYIFKTSNLTDDIDLFIQKMILKQYYLMEIGFETPAEFIIAISNYYDMNRIKYHTLYNNLLNIYNMNISGSKTKSSTSTGTDSGTSTDTDNSTTASTNRYSDTPQGGLTGLENDRYLTNANITNENGTKSNSYSKNFANSNNYNEVITDDSIKIDNIKKVFTSNLNVVQNIIDEYRKFFMLLY